MKGKMKNIIAGIATLAMVAQFGFVVPASAANLPFTMNFEDKTVGQITDTAFAKSTNAQDYLEIKEDSTHGKYFSFDRATSVADAPTGNARNDRGADLYFTPDVSGLDDYVVEFKARIKSGDQNGATIAIKTSDAAYGLDTNSKQNQNNNLASGYLFKLGVDSGSVGKINDTTNTVALADETWYNYKLIVDAKNGYTSVTISDPSTDKALEGADKVVVGISGTKRDIKGLYILDGRYEPRVDIDDITVRAKTGEDEFGDLPPEYLNSLSFATSSSEGTVLPAKVTPPAEEGATDTYYIDLESTGTLGHDLFETYPDKYTVDWKVIGLSGEDGYINIILNDDDNTNLTTSDDDTVEGSKATGATVTVRDGVSNWFANIEATIHYTASDDTVASMTASKQFIVSAAAANSAIIFPATGYPENASDYDNGLVGYKAHFDGNPRNRDTILGWGITAGNGDGYIELCKEEETGDKYLDFSSGVNSGSKSTVAAVSIGSITSEFALDTVMKFDSDTTWGYYNKTPNNGGLETAFAFRYNGGTISSGEGSIADLSNDTWYRIIVYCNRTEGVYSLYVLDPVTGSELGSIKEQTTGGSTATTIEYFASGMGNTANVHRYIKSCKIYYPAISSITLNSESGSMGVPAVDADEIKGKGLEESTVYSYNDESKQLTVTVPERTAPAKLIVAQYSTKKLLTDLDIKDLTFTEGAATVTGFTLPDSCKLMLWENDLDKITPIKPAEGTGIDNPNRAAAAPVTMDVTAQLVSADGIGMSSGVTWSIDTDDPAIELVSEESQSVKLKVSEGAPAGPVVITAKNGAKSVEKEIMLTTTGNSVAFTEQKGSITIPFTGEEAKTATYAARTMMKNGQPAAYAFDDDGNPTETPAEITYTVLDKNLANITNRLPAGITFDKTSGELSVSSEAKTGIIYVQATNNDETPLSRSVKVNIHGLSFTFGSDEPADDSFTQVTGDETYNTKTGYGFADTSVLKTNAGNVSGSADYQFKVDVPNGNYGVTVTTSASEITSEVVDSVPAVTGIAKKTANKFNVAVCDGVLDLTFPKDATVTSIAVEQKAIETATKPMLYAIGDSTTNNSASGAKSWGNCVAGGDVTIPNSLAGFSNNGMAGRDSVNFYNQGRVETVLLSVKKGDYVTVNMGINSKETGEANSYYTLLDQYYVNAIKERGAIPVIVTATPQGPVNGHEGNYSGGVFNCSRGDGAHNGDLRTIAKKYDLNIIELGEWCDAYFNALTTEDATAAGASSVLELVQSWYTDHNHYKQDLGVVIGNYILDCVDKITKDSAAFSWTKDSNIAAD